MDIDQIFASLEFLAKSEDSEKINTLFQNLVVTLSSFLNFTPIHKNIRIHLNNEKTGANDSPFNIGVTRENQGDIIQIEIIQEYVKFLPFILLREAYYGFLPKRTKSVDVAINSIVEKNLENITLIDNWKHMIRTFLIDDDHTNKILSAFERLFADTEVTIFILFNYIRNNISIIDRDIDDFIKRIQEETILILSESLRNDELLETIRVVVEIFYTVKNYSALLDYTKYFKEFKENNRITTQLSLTHFIANMRLVKRSLISPTYQVYWNPIGARPVFGYFKFHPKITVAQINEFFKDLPFLLSPRRSSSGFSHEISGYFLIPIVYIEDLKNLFQRLKSQGVFIEVYLLKSTDYYLNTNLNFFIRTTSQNPLINPSSKNYNKDYELEFKIHTPPSKIHEPLTLLDFLILDRIRYLSTNSFGFQPRKNTLKLLKDDRLGQIIYQQNLIKKLKNLANQLFSHHEFRTNFITFLNRNKDGGFFVIRNALNKVISLVGRIESYFSRNKSLKNQSQLIKQINEYGITNLIEENLFLKEKKVRRILFKDLLPLYYNSKKNYQEKVKEIKLYNDFIDICFNLKIFSLTIIKRIVQNPKELETIDTIKEEMLEDIYEKLKSREITSKEVEDRLARFLSNDPPIITPVLTNTIPFPLMNMQFFLVLIENEGEVLRILKRYRKYLHLVTVVESIDLLTNRKIVILGINLHKFHYKEINQLLSNLKSNFKEQIITTKPYFYAGWNPVSSLQSFYDFKKSKFFYSKDLFNQYSLKANELFGGPLKLITNKKNDIHQKLFSNKVSMSDLYKMINVRLYKEAINYNYNQLKRLQEFHLSLNDSLSNVESFKQVRKKPFFTTYIKSLRFLPSFQHFGFDQYYLYIYPTNVDKINLKLLLLNTFQKIICPASIEKTNSLLIKYIMPLKRPNKKFLNWIKSTNKLREYCFFSIKKLHCLLQFDKNIDETGWNYDYDKFKDFIQNILFNPEFKTPTSAIREFSISNQSSPSIFSPDSSEYKALTNIYNHRSIDIKSYLSGKTLLKEHQITDLLKKGLIFPFIKLKNLDFREKLIIIIPNITIKARDALIAIFRFFNYGFIYEIEGEYFITEFEDKITFEEGLLVKLYFPNSKFRHSPKFLELFDSIFQWLEVEHYIYLYDYINGNQILKSLFKDLNFEKYNPLKNLKWNHKDKIWMNHKILTQKFEPIYPDIYFSEKSINFKNM